LEIFFKTSSGLRPPPPDRGGKICVVRKLLPLCEERVGVRLPRKVKWISHCIRNDEYDVKNLLRLSATSS